YCHKDFHRNILLNEHQSSYVSDFGLTELADKQKSNDKYMDFGIIMAELSTGNPPFYDRKHDVSLALDICNGLRPEFGKGTPEFYKELAYRCMRF
ncbi:7213_t:CDS:2, partial [Funneliformis geosporum]